MEDGVPVSCKEALESQGGRISLGDCLDVWG
jgi:hypothetical protein